MSTLKVALIACGVAMTLAATAQAYELRPGNGTNTVTINPSSDRAVVAARRGDTSSIETLFGRANGSR